MVWHGQWSVPIAYCKKQNEDREDSLNALAFGFAGIRHNDASTNLQSRARALKHQLPHTAAWRFEF